MEPQQIRNLVNWLQDRVDISGEGKNIMMSFDVPSEADFLEAGFDRSMMALTLEADWWEEMIGDIMETPDFAAPDDEPSQILKYARDIVHEYIAKRII